MAISLPTLLALLVWTPALVGLGSLVRLEVAGHVRVGVTGLLGLTVLGLLAMWINLFVPISPAVSVGLYATGLASLAWKGRGSLALLRTDLVPLVGLAALVALQPPLETYDAGLYYLQAVEWVRSHPQVAGLANLHGRFGFNSAWFVVGAALELPLLRGHGEAFAGGLPVVLAGLAATGAIRRCLAGDRSLPTVMFAFLAVPASLGLASIGSHAPDPVVDILAFTCFCLWAASLEDGRWRDAWGPALLLASFALAVKVSAAPLVAGAVLVAAIAVRETPEELRASTVARYAGWTGSLLLPWGVRGLLASGCWIYPVPFTCVTDLRWSVPLEEVRTMGAWIRGWARSPGSDPAQALAGWGWVGPWASRIANEPILRVLGAWMACGLAAMAGRRSPPNRAGSILGLVAIAGVLFWLATAPDPRFGLACLVPLAVLPAAVAFRAPEAGTGGRSSVPRVLALGAIVLAVVAVASVEPAGRRRAGIPTVATTWPEPRAPLVHPERNGLGTRILVPDRGDQCWSAPLPCAPSLDARLGAAGRVFWIERPGPPGR